MPWFITPLLVYLALINLLAAFVTVYDKKMARKGKWRVPEQNLLILSALGGAPAMYLTMRCIRHKTQKKKFMVGIPVIFILEAAMVIFILFA